MNNWKYDWIQFAIDVTETYKIYGNLELAKKYEGTSVKWQGFIKKLELDAEYTPGIQMSMPVMNELNVFNKKLMMDYLFLPVRKEDAHIWRSYKNGDSVIFSATIKNSNIFSPVKISLFEEEEECTLDVSIECAYPDQI
jgi:hypothetical protein